LQEVYTKCFLRTAISFDITSLHFLDVLSFTSHITHSAPIRVLRDRSLYINLVVSLYIVRIAYIWSHSFSSLTLLCPVPATCMR